MRDTQCDSAGYENFCGGYGKKDTPNTSKPAQVENEGDHLVQVKQREKHIGAHTDRYRAPQRTG